MLRSPTLLLALTFMNPACGTTDPHDTAPSNSGGTGSVGGSTGSSTQPQAGTGSTPGGATSTTTQDGGGGFDQNATAGCEVWPASKLAPMVGVRFYGPDPGPCTITLAGSSTPVILTYAYDSSNRPTRAASADNTTVWSFTYAGDLMTSEVDTANGGTSTIIYDYSAGALGYSYKSAAGTADYTASYTLDARGYPQLVTISGPGVTSGRANRYAYTYDGCRMSVRTAYNADNTVNASSTQQYSYDAQGHLVRIFSTTGLYDYTFDYSCWPH